MISLEYARIICEDCGETVQLIQPGVSFTKLEECKCKKTKKQKSSK